ncbi:cell division protein SepF [Collinsella tanakaei]|uniref:cell division protein SepF n=1 Tax=Collinsella tanakaei TaxID=626935 RepID=UPI001F2356EF|nr:cell division protein SepF [Collinsella tanakaei]MCF2621035.1 cell division protein SepF [Collinsella tanakaei]MDM8302152.1 cell division protein SepF [Collinsella tanakaei]
MNFLEEIKNRFAARQAGYDQDGYEGDEGYEDEYYEDEPAGDYGAHGGYGSDSYGFDQQDSGHGVLGQTHRGEAESVAVYTRSGQLVGDADRHATTFNPPARSADAPSYRPGAYDTPSSYAESRRHAAAQPAPTTSEAVSHISSVVNGTPQLPMYVLRPESYDDVETVVRRVRTRQPVALIFVGVRTEIAKRVLDFSYGFACGLGASVKELGDRVFIVLPQGCEVKDSDLAKLRADGYLK